MVPDVVKKLQSLQSEFEAEKAKRTSMQQRMSRHLRRAAVAEFRREASCAGLVIETCAQCYPRASPMRWRAFPSQIRAYHEASAKSWAEIERYGRIAQHRGPR